MQVDPSSAAAPVSKLDMALGDLTKQARRNRHHKRKPKTGGSASSSVAVQPKVELGSKLLVSNLHVAVTEADLKVSPRIADNWRFSSRSSSVAVSRRRRRNSNI